MAAAVASVAVLAGVALPQQPRGQGQCYARVAIPLAHRQTLHYTNAFLGDTSLQHHNHLHANSSSMATAVAPRAAAVGTITKEAATGIDFSNALSIAGVAKELSLVGIGVREKQIAFLRVKVYAVGFYIDASSLATEEVSWKGKGGSELAKDEGFFKFLIDAPVEKALKIVLARDVAGSQFWGALDEALTPRLKAAGAGQAGQDALAAFGAVFRDRSLTQGTTIYLTWAPPCTLQITISSGSGTAPDASIESPTLLPCLFDVYLGPDTVSTTLRASVANGFPSVL